MRLVIIIMLILFSQVKANAGKEKGTKTNCHPSEYSMTPNDLTSSGYKVTYKWIYDDRGRLTGDSVVISDPMENQSYFESFIYKGDSVWHISNYSTYQDTSLTIFNRQGMLVKEILPYGIEYVVYYRPNGELEKMERVTPRINKHGLYETLKMICDSVVYKDGNIVSYRINDPNTSFDVSCAYYEEAVPDTAFYPVGKLTGLSSNPMNQFGNLKVNLFSKNLPKKMECRYGSLEFIFDFDKLGRVISFDRNFIYINEGRTTSYQSDHNTVKYQCN